jgi:hypothetical protein
MMFLSLCIVKFDAASRALAIKATLRKLQRVPRKNGLALVSRSAQAHRSALRGKDLGLPQEASTAKPVREMTGRSPSLDEEAER